MIVQGDSLGYLEVTEDRFDLVATDPPYAFGGTGPEHALSAAVAVVLRESARKLKQGGWLVVFCASSWRSAAYMAEAVRGLVEPVRTGFWGKGRARSKARTPGWAWATVQVMAFRKGKSDLPPVPDLDYIICPPRANGRRAELPAAVADWAVRPFARPGGLMLDPFAGSGALCLAAEGNGMRAIGYELNTTAGEVPGGS